MYNNSTEVIEAGFNCFKWLGKTYRISFGIEGLVFGEEVGNKESKKAVPFMALNEEDFLYIPLNDEEQKELDKIHTEIGF